MNFPIYALVSDIMMGRNKSAPAMLATSQGADDHRVRMNAMGSITQHLHFHTAIVESVEGCRKPVSTNKIPQNPHKINEIEKRSIVCRKVEALPGGYHRAPSSHSADTNTPPSLSTFRQFFSRCLKPP